MTARLVLNAEPGQKVGLGNGLRLVCDKRNGSRYFELRKRVRGGITRGALGMLKR